MKRLDAAGEILEASRIEKSDTGITGYDENGKVAFSVEGIKTFSAFTLLDNAEWDIPEEKEIDRLRSEVEQLRLEVNQIKGGIGE